MVITTGEFLLISSGCRPEVLLNILQCIRQPLTTKNCPAPNDRWTMVEETRAWRLGERAEMSSVHGVPWREQVFVACEISGSSQRIQEGHTVTQEQLGMSSQPGGGHGQMGVSA